MPRSREMQSVLSWGGWGDSVSEKQPRNETDANISRRVYHYALYV